MGGNYNPCSTTKRSLFRILVCINIFFVEFFDICGFKNAVICIIDNFLDVQFNIEKTSLLLLLGLGGILNPLYCCRAL